MSLSVSSEFFITPTVSLKMKNFLLLSIFLSVIFFNQIFLINSNNSEESLIKKTSESSSLEISYITGEGLKFRLSNDENIGKKSVFRSRVESALLVSAAGEDGGEDSLRSRRTSTAEFLSGGGRRHVLRVGRRGGGDSPGGGGLLSAPLEGHGAGCGGRLCGSVTATTFPSHLSHL